MTRLLQGELTYEASEHLDLGSLAGDDCLCQCVDLGVRSVCENIIGHVDCTLICEYPKVGPHAAAMKAEMARIMGMTPDRISVKATTSERLGFTGRGEGIAAIATATLVKT